MYSLDKNVENQEYHILDVYEKAKLTKVIATMLGKEGYIVCLFDKDELPSDIVSSAKQMDERALDGLGLLRFVRQSFPRGRPLIVKLNEIEDCIR